MEGHTRKHPREERSYSSEGIVLDGGHAQPTRMVTFFRDGRLCDVEIKPGSFSAHRNVLAASSEYFSGLFAGATWSDSNDKSIELPAVAYIVELVLEFIYTGRCVVLDQDDVSHVLELANFLQIAPLIHSCTTQLEMSLVESNALEFWLVAEKFSLNELKEAAIVLAALDFGNTVSKDEFVQMPLSFIKPFFTSPELSAAQEIDVFYAINRWVQGQTELPSSDFVRELLKTVRYPSISLEDVRGKVETQEIMQNHMVVLLQSYQTMYYKPDQMKPRSKDPQYSDADIPEKLRSYIHDCIVAMGLDGELVEFVPPEDRGSLLAKLEVAKQRASADHDASLLVHATRYKILTSQMTVFEWYRGEHLARDDWVAAFRATISNYIKGADNPRYNYIAPDKLQQLKEKCKEESHWLDTMVQRQETLQKHVRPVLLCYQIESRTKALAVFGDGLLMGTGRT